jgi:hypothetical protein
LEGKKRTVKTVSREAACCTAKLTNPLLAIGVPGGISVKNLPVREDLIGQNKRAERYPTPGSFSLTVYASCLSVGRDSELHADINIVGVFNLLSIGLVDFFPFKR